MKIYFAGMVESQLNIPKEEFDKLYCSVAYPQLKRQKTTAKKHWFIDTIREKYSTVTVQFHKQFLNCTDMEYNTLPLDTTDTAPAGLVSLAMSPSALDPRFNKVDAVVAWLTERIEMRFYAPSARVPSVRQLADKLEVSRFTVVNAYEKMVASGVLSSRAG